MIRVPLIVRTLLRSNPIYRFGGSHGELDKINIFSRDNKSGTYKSKKGYFLNPNETTRRIMRIIAQHEKVEDPESLTLNTQWHEIGTKWMIARVERVGFGVVVHRNREWVRYWVSGRSDVEIQRHPWCCSICFAFILGRMILYTKLNLSMRGPPVHWYMLCNKSDNKII